MANFVDCVEQAFRQKRISQAIRDQVVSSNDPQAELDNILATKSRQKREAIIQAVRMNDLLIDIKSHPKGMAAGLAATMTKDIHGEAKYDNVDYLAAVEQARYHSKVAEFLSRFRTRKLGFSQDTEGLEDLVRAMHGRQSSDADINGFANDLKNLFEEIRVIFNNAGGSIAKNVGWNLPQQHNKIAIEKAGQDVWLDYVFNRLDRTKMVDDLGNPLSDTQLTDALKYVYKTIITDGLHKTQELTSSPRMGSKLSRKHSEQRFIYFKDGDAWLDYHRRFGSGDILTTITGHIDTLGHEVALMKKFGPNPKASFDALFNEIKKAGQDTKVFGSLEWIFKVISGEVNQVQNVTMADFMQTTRNVLTASTLGSAFLSAISDVSFSAITSRYNSIPYLKVLGKQMSLMSPTNEADRIAAVKIGLTADSWVGMLTAANRYADVYGVGTTAKMAEAVMRGSLLSPWTDAGRKAFGMEFASLLADNYGKRFDDLDPNLKKAFESYDIAEADWDVLRQQTTFDHNGARYANLTTVEAAKFHRMVLTETDFAVPTPDSRIKAIQRGGMKRGTFEGEAWRSAMMLKSFPMTVISTHLYRMAQQEGMVNKLSYAAQLFIGGMIMGGVALQAKDIAAGREPRPIDAKFIPAAIAQGGGLGIFGDFIFSDQNRFGGGPASTVLGPVGELANKTTSLTLGNIQQAVKGEETNVLGEATQYLKRYTPNTWQLNLFKNAIFDQIALHADPVGERKRHRRIIQSRQKDYDQGFWWKPGEPLPEFIKD